MDRKSFFTKTCQCGLAAMVGSLLPAAHSKAAGSIFSDDENPQLTPCNEKTDFAKIWVKRFFDQLDENVDEDTKTKLMHGCGKQCFIGAHEVDHPQPETISLSEFIQKWGDNGWQEGDNYFIKFVQNRRGLKPADGYCLCPLTEDGPNDLSATYCKCSEGYVKEMMSWYAGAKVTVENIESVRKGHKNCTFKIKTI